MDSDDGKVRFIIISGVIVFVILPLLVTFIFLFLQQINSITEEKALHTSVEEEIALAVSSENGLDLNEVAIHEVERDGDWLAVIILSTQTVDFGNVTTAILHKEDGKYKTVYLGTSYDEDYMDSLKIPKGFIQKVTKTNVIDEYLNAIGKASTNPMNKYSLIQSLPYKTEDLVISYIFEDDIKDEEGDNIPVITVDGVDAVERIRALNKIKSLGYDLGKYPIKFTNFNNLFIDDEKVDYEEVKDGVIYNEVTDEEGP